MGKNKIFISFFANSSTLLCGIGIAQRLNPKSWKLIRNCTQTFSFALFFAQFSIGSFVLEINAYSSNTHKHTHTHITKLNGQNMNNPNNLLLINCIYLSDNDTSGIESQLSIMVEYFIANYLQKILISKKFTLEIPLSCINLIFFKVVSFFNLSFSSDQIN